MKLRLYQFASSPFCAKVRKILDYKGTDYEIVEVDYLERGDLLRVSGQVMVPALSFADGETMTGSDRIAERLEELYPDLAVFPPQWRGIHIALARYFDTELEDLLFRAALPDELAYYARRSPAHEAFFRLIRDRKYGAGFCERMVAEADANWKRVRAALVPLDETLADRAFLLGRIGYADFALYGQLYYFAFTGELKIPTEFTHLRAFFDRMDRISSLLDGNQ